MSAIANMSNKHVDNIKAERSDRNLWIYGYDLSVEGTLSWEGYTATLLVQH
jgi:hypothetical protein